MILILPNALFEMQSQKVHFAISEINITSYSLQSGSNNDFLKDWVIEASDDQQIWTEIDRHSNEDKLKGPDKIGSFVVQNNPEFYRFVRLRQSGKSWSNHFSFGLKRFEFFGKIKHK